MKSKIKSIFCILFRHSNIVDFSWGYATCGRCGKKCARENTSSQVMRRVEKVIIGHNCEVCRNNYKNLTFIDKFLSPSKSKIFAKEEELDGTDTTADQIQD